MTDFEPSAGMRVRIVMPKLLAAKLWPRGEQLYDTRDVEVGETGVICDIDHRTYQITVDLGEGWKAPGLMPLLHVCEPITEENAL